jgi:CHAT domain-containing protein
LRSRPAGNPAGSLLALAGGADAAGRPLRGAGREVRWLSEHLARVTVRADVPESGRAELLAELCRCEAMHVAAHVELNAEAPWRSGILLHTADRPREQDYLRASTIAGMRLRARLAVVSSCQSRGSAAFPGQSVIGFSTAFLSAGVPATVCTLWPIDDDATALFMQDFYRRLARGGSPSDALRAAQLASRARPGTRHPFYWAGFVMVGDPDARVALRPRI